MPEAVAADTVMRRQIEFQITFLDVGNISDLLLRRLGNMAYPDDYET